MEFEKLPSDLKAYFISQTDPFHDNPYRLEGAPSSVSSQSVVFTINTEQTVTSTSFGLSGTPGSKWDMHIACMPIVSPVQMIGCNQSYPSAVRNATVNFAPLLTFGPLTVNGVDSGVSTFVCTETTPVAQYLALPNAVDTSLTFSGSLSSVAGRLFREIGRSFEVVDVTPNLYRQGAVTSYEYPSFEQFTNVLMAPMANSATTTANVLRSCSTIIGPPTNIGDAVRIPGSQTWDSQQGVYTIPRKFVEEVPYQKLGCDPIVVLGTPDNSTPAAGVIQKSFCTSTAAATSFVVNAALNATSPYNCYGAYFTGLSGEYGTYRIRLKQIFEILSPPSDLALLPLMTPTVPRTPEFEEYLNRILATLRATVPQTMNPKGELWRQVLRSSSKIGKKLVPIASLVAPELGVAVDVMSDLGTRVSKPKAKAKGKQAPAKKGKS